MQRSEVTKSAATLFTYWLHLCTVTGQVLYMHQLQPATITSAIYYISGTVTFRMCIGVHKVHTMKFISICKPAWFTSFGIQHSFIITINSVMAFYY